MAYQLSWVISLLKDNNGIIQPIAEEWGKDVYTFFKGLRPKVKNIIARLEFNSTLLDVAVRYVYQYATGTTWWWGWKRVFDISPYSYKFRANLAAVYRFVSQ